MWFSMDHAYVENRHARRVVSGRELMYSRDVLTVPIGGNGGIFTIRLVAHHRTSSNSMTKRDWRNKILQFQRTPEV